MPKFRGKQNYMGAWHYVLLDILYVIPVIGFIALLVHAFSDKNENRRHYARSYFARFLLFIILCLIGTGLYYLIAGSEAFSKTVSEIEKQWKSYTRTEKKVVTQIVPIQQSTARPITGSGSGQTGTQGSAANGGSQTNP